MTAPADDRPLVTFALFAYNQEQFIREAVEGAFAQTYEPLEIILSDDRSSDRTFEIMQEMAAAYRGPHRVRVRRSEVNRGLLSHINDAATEFRGEIIVVAAGDDVSLPHRTSVSVNAFLLHPELRALCTSFHTINDLNHDDDKNGRLEFVSTLEIALNGGGIGKGATYTYHRDCFFTPGPLPDHLYSEDRILPLRAALIGKVGFLNCQTVAYRVLDTGMGRELRRTGMLSFALPQHVSHLISEIKEIAPPRTHWSSLLYCGMLRIRRGSSSRPGDRKLTRVARLSIRRSLSMITRLLPRTRT